MVLRLDLAPAVALRKSISRAAFFTGLMIYLEALAALVLLTERRLAPAAFFALGLVLLAQAKQVWRPARLLAAGRLVPAYRSLFLLAAVYVALLWLGSGAVAASFGALAVLAASWPVQAAMRVAVMARGQMGAASSPEALLGLLAFDLRGTLALKLRSFGLHRLRAASGWLIGAAALAGAGIGTGLLQETIGFSVGPIVQACLLGAAWLLYRGMRHIKLRAPELIERDSRRPVLILREFRDDRLMMQRFNLAPRLSFERVVAAELERIGPVVSLGRPGERLPPLGASRTYARGDWKQTVSGLIEDAGVVVFVLGESESLQWELGAAVAGGGKEKILVVVPPLRNPGELRRRWERFPHPAHDLSGFHPPDEPVLAFFFAGDDVVLMTGARRELPGYKLALRLFGRLFGLRPSSACDVGNFLRNHIPILSLSRVENASRAV